MNACIRQYHARAWLVLGGLLLGGCASAPPEIREAPPSNPEVAEVSRQPDEHREQAVRWGGLILETENRAEATAITVLALPLNKNGKPQTGDVSAGRFIALVPQFLEPTVYTADRMFTVKGTVTGAETRKVGEFPYHYPVIRVEHYYLWPVEPVLSEEDYRYPWWWYDPWYYPWYPNYYPHRRYY